MTVEICNYLSGEGKGEVKEKKEGKDLQRFLKGNWESDLEQDEEDFFAEKVLMEFPIFALNDDYMKAIH